MKIRVFCGKENKMGWQLTCCWTSRLVLCLPWGEAMLQELKFQLSTAVLTVLTVAAAISAGINFSQQLLFRLPDDGVTWVDQAKPGSVTVVQARRVVPNSGADNAGLRDGDILLKINGLTFQTALLRPPALVR